MTNRLLGRIARPIAAASSLLIGALGIALAPSAWAAGVATLSGTTTNSCSYSSIQSLPDGTVTVTCTTSTPTSTTLSFGNVSGSLATVGTSVALLPVSCSGACSGAVVGLAVTTPASGVTLGAPSLSFTGAGSQTISVNGAGGLSPGNAVITLTVNSIGTGATSSTPALNGTASTNVPIVDATSPGTLAFSPTAASVTEGTTPTTVSVTRTGAGTAAPDVTVAYSCTAAPTGYLPTYTPGPTGTLSWTGADAAAKTFTITPLTLPTGATTGTVTCTLGTSSGGPTVSTTAYTLTVTKAATGGTCTTVADKEYDLSTGALWRAIPSLGGTQTAAIKIKGLIGSKTSFMMAGTWPVPGTTPPSGVQYNIAECPGDFTTSMQPICGPRYTTTGFSARFSSLDRVETWYCDKLDPAKTYYFNVRYVNPSTNTTTCTSSSCLMYLDLSGE